MMNVTPFHSHDLSMLFTAFVFASDKHRDQRRKDSSATPYINHPISVANHLVQAGVTDVAVLVGALLHDTIEDTQTTDDEIRQEFGGQICNIVMDCSDDKSLDKVMRKKLQISHACEISDRSKLVKLSDKLDNCQGLMTNPPKKWTSEEIYGYAVWAYCCCRHLYLDSTSNVEHYHVSQKLKARLDDVFQHWQILDLSEYDLELQLNTYYTRIDNSE